MALKPLRGALAEWTPGRGSAADPLQAVAAAWPAIVGPNVAAHSAPLSLSGGTLTIATRSSAWSQQLQFLSTAILAGVRALPQAAEVERLSFRAGAMRRAQRRAPGRAAKPPGTVLRTPAPGPAADLGEAFERVRQRVTALRRQAPATCRTCGVPLPEAPGDGRCAPCVGAAERERANELQRLVYMAPWLTLADVRETLPAVSAAEFERARRHLLQRWWLVLERVRRAGPTGVSPLERNVASSYVLLQSRLPPDRITPAVVLNVLGPELHALLWPDRR